MPRVTKTPAFPFYGKDAYDDEGFSRLSFAEQGFYLYLAWWQWQEGSIPAELDDILDKVPRKKVTEARRMWPTLAHHFPVIADGGRRQSSAVEGRREDIARRRNKNRFGAEITNAQRSIQRALSGTLSDTLSVLDTAALRAAGGTASANAPAEPRGAGEDSVALVRQATAIAVPHLPPPEEPILALWLRDISPDPWWLAAVLLEATQSLSAAKTWAYVTASVANRKREGWTCDDPKGYVEFRLAAAKRKQSA